ncbi:MAG: SDR family oxidoreductase [Anaerolineaceae bacterium]|nr:SDR family oxidoreductase [Anaerolineaceae bacterium]
MNELNNKVAVVTGGTRGLGLGIAETYAAAGAKVVIAGRSQSTLDRALKTLHDQGAVAAGISCDVSDLEQVEALGRYAIESYGKIDIWVNNAGLSAPFGPTVSTPIPTFMNVINTNIIGVYYGSMVALRHMLPQGSGKLINLLGRGDKKGVPFQNAYSASKVWVRNFTTSLAKENKDSGVDIFSFNPGLVDTDMIRQVEAINGYEKRLKPLETVIRLWANPPEVPAQKALWLASSASDGKNGLSVTVLDFKTTVGGLLRDAWRRITRQPAPDTSLDITTVMAEK